MLMGKPVTFEGWHAAMCSLWIGGDALFDVIATDTPRVWSVVVASVCLALSALSNVLVMLACARLISRRPWRPSTVSWSTWAIGLVLALAAPVLAGPNLLPGLERLVGYACWIAAWVVLGAALLAARRRGAITP